MKSLVCQTGTAVGGTLTRVAREIPGARRRRYPTPARRRIQIIPR